MFVLYALSVKITKKIIEKKNTEKIHVVKSALSNTLSNSIWLVILVWMLNFSLQLGATDPHVWSSSGWIFNHLTESVMLI